MRRSIPIYNEALKREIDKIASRLPHDQIAIQFDVASAVFARLERNDESAYGRGKAETQGDLQPHPDRSRQPRAARHRADVSFLLRRFNHRHVVEPTDMADMVELANRLTRGMARPIELIHMPVPRDRADDAYFAPLKALETQARNQALPGSRASHRRRRGQHAAAWRRRSGWSRISRSRPNAASAAAVPRQFPSCCASTPRWPVDAAAERQLALVWHQARAPGWPARFGVAPAP